MDVQLENQLIEWILWKNVKRIASGEKIDYGQSKISL